MADKEVSELHALLVEIAIHLAGDVTAWKVQNQECYPAVPLLFKTLKVLGFNPETVEADLGDSENWTKTSIVLHKVLHEMRRKADLDLAREEMNRMREETRQKTGTVDLAVDLIREARGGE